MSNFVQVFLEKMRPHRRTLLIIALVILFAVASYFLYYRVMKPQIKETSGDFKNIANRDKNLNSTAEIMIFSATWCPICRKTAGDWDKFAKEYNGKRINGHKIVCKKIDCTDEDDEYANKMMQTFQISGFPTVKAVLNDKVIEFDAKVTFDNLEKFVNEL